MKTELLVASIIVVVAYFGILFTHDYIYYVSPLEKIEFETLLPCHLATLR